MTSLCFKHGVSFNFSDVCQACVLEKLEISQKINPTLADTTEVGGSHYKDIAIQPWDVMQAVLTPEEFVGYLKGSVLKYSLRAGKKAGADDDADKAKHYVKKLREVQA